MLSGCVGYQEVQTLLGWEKIYAPDMPQALEVTKGSERRTRHRVFRWEVAVQEYSFRVEDIPGKENIGAGFLSRTGYSC